MPVVSLGEMLVPRNISASILVSPALAQVNAETATEMFPKDIPRIVGISVPEVLLTQGGLKTFQIELFFHDGRKVTTHKNSDEVSTFS